LERVNEFKLENEPFEEVTLELTIFEDVTFEEVTFATVLYTGASTAPPVPTMIIELVTEPMERLENEALDPNTFELYTFEKL
jgi:hypothetical protein